MNVHFFKTPKGEEMAVLPRSELETLTSAIEHSRAVSDYRAGRLPGLTADETRALTKAPSLLEFWRKRAGLTQAVLAGKIGVTQHYLSDVENGKRVGPVELWLKIARALELPVDALIEE